MTWLDEPPVHTVFRRREAESIDERRLRRSVERGEVVRIAPGSYVSRSVWRGATRLAQHAQRVWEAAVRTEPGTVFSHHAASALWGMDALGPWPTRVDTTLADSGGGRSTGLIRRHARRGVRMEVVPWGEHFLTTPEQTALDLAATRPVAEGVAAIDQALWIDRPGGALTGTDALHSAADAYVGRGFVRARRCAEFGDGLAANVRESQSRVLIDALGFPPPVLQHRFELPSGRLAFGDFWWPRWSVLGELDGMQKYLDPAMTGGRDPSRVLADEKDREDELRRVVRRVARWRTTALDRPQLLWDILVAAGLPAASPRPGR